MVDEIATQLGETEPGPIESIARILNVLGEAETLTLANEAVRIFNSEGVLTHDGARKRTLGGVFFYLVTGQINVPQYKKIWPDRKIPWFVWQKSQKEEKKPGPRPWAYADLYGMSRALSKVAGEMEMDVKLIGKHGKVIKRKDLVITAVTSTVPRDKVPAGLPKPPTDPTPYLCYIPLQQWDNLPHPCENIEITGYAGLDLENLDNDIIVVWTSEVKAA